MMLDQFAAKTNRLLKLYFKSTSISIRAAVVKAITNAPHDTVAEVEEQNLQKGDKTTESTDTTTICKPFLQKELLEVKSRFDFFKEGIESLSNYPPYGLTFDWPSRWPTAAPFNPHLVPLPIRMGHPQNRCVNPGKFGNLELLKLQNFLHLTPPAVERHCEVLKQFCTPFPSELKSDEACEKAFPVESHSVDYLGASTSVRDQRARVVTKTIRLCNFVLHQDARKKMIQLLGKERYDRRSDVATIKAKRCPTRKQNSDFIDYVLTALYFESWKKEKWESRANMDDYDCYYWWEDSNSHKNLKNIFKDCKGDFFDKPEVQDYRKAVIAIKTDPEPDELGELTKSRSKALDDYKQSVLKLLNINQSI